MEKIKNVIEQGNAVLGIEFGSTRIKAVLIDEKNRPAAQGVFQWENRWENQIWIYHLDEIDRGLVECYKSLKADVKRKYGITLKKVGAIGISAMMHGYMAFDRDGNLLVPFRTWRNTITAEASAILMKKFAHPIPQRWSIAHLYQAILNEEEHVKDIAYLTTLDGYIHWRLTGKKVLGIGQASGMFPIDTTVKDYDVGMLDKFRSLIRDRDYPWDIRDILPQVLTAGESAGTLRIGIDFLTEKEAHGAWRCLLLI